MEIKKLEAELTVCKAVSLGDIELNCEPLFIGKTDEELSVVCPTAVVPERTTARDDGWRGFRIQGVLDFSLTGILSRISGILADEKIGIFAVSTYNTDYVLVKQEDLERALGALAAAGYDIV